MGWQECQSSPTRTLHQQETLTHFLYCALPPRLSSSWSAHIHAQDYLVSLTQTFTLSTTVLKRWHTSNSRPLSIVVHPRARRSYLSSRRDHNLSIILTHRYSSTLEAHATSWKLCIYIHGFPCEGPFMFSVVCMFSLPIRGLYICLHLPSCELGYSFPSLDCVSSLVLSLFRLGHWFSPHGWLCLPWSSLHFGEIVAIRLRIILATIGLRMTQELSVLS